MSLTLHFHPLASFCQKALIALYENDTPFTPKLVDLGNETERAALLKLWPIGKFPVLRDDIRDQTIPESSIIIEYLDRHYPGRTRFIPDDADRAWQTRLRDRFYDLYVHVPMQKIMLDRLRPDGQAGSARRRRSEGAAADLLRHDRGEMAAGGWAMGRSVRHRRLRGVRRRCSMATWWSRSARPQESHGVSRTPEGASFRRARAEGGRAVFRAWSRNELTSEIISSDMSVP